LGELEGSDAGVGATCWAAAAAAAGGDELSTRGGAGSTFGRVNDL